MTGISPWAAITKKIFSDPDISYVYKRECGDFTFLVYNTGDSLWAMMHWPKGDRLAVRIAYSPNDMLFIDSMEEKEEKLRFSLLSVIGDYTVELKFPEAGLPFFRYTCSITPHEPLLIPFWPRDIIPLGKTGDAAGEVHVRQAGARSGLVYFSITKPKSGSVLYLQNLTALNDYCKQTETSLADTVGGQWPELGFELPPAKEKPLAAGKSITISDAFIICSADTMKNEFDMAKQFIDLLARIYIHLPKPDTQYRDWLSILDKTLHDLKHNSGCWLHAKGHSYLNAYVSDYTTPPEIMVQLAVLLPLIDYSAWSKKELSIIKELTDGLETFYDKKIGTVVRWLPAMQDKLDGKEEHKSPRVMDSWYLHHPLLNLSRMALQGDSKVAKKLFLDSVEYAIKVAHHFKYEWPVFYNIDTLEVVKAETQPGKGGEKDVPGTYAHIMLQAWELTKEKRYLDEAKEAAKALKGTGFSLFYQANNTAFSSGAMLRLWKETKDEQYLNLSYLCLANVFKNVWLWDCKYGYAKNYPTFFAVFPLNDAPYTAVYEEQEVFAAFHDYLSLAEGEDILPSVSMLLSEFIRFLMNRGNSYYPPELPKDMLADKVRTGEVDPKLWIPIEDIHDGWEKSGEVGQEVYGAGFAFGLVSSHYFEVPGEHFMLYIDYPIADFHKSGKTLTFAIKGDDRLSCRLLIIPSGDQPLPSFTITGNIQDGEMKGRKTSSGQEYSLNGNQKITIKWEPPSKKINGRKIIRRKTGVKT